MGSSIFRRVAVAVAGLSLLAGRAAAAAPYTLANTEVRPLPHSANGRDYTLYIGLPASYATSPTRSYPVVYLTDGYWDFNLLVWETGNLVVDGLIPECIVVGIAYSGDNPDVSTLRQYDLTPGYDPYAGPNSGHAQEFLGVIAGQFIPFVEQNYRVDRSYRVLGGSSYGGLFSLYALFEMPSLFNAHIAVSPALWYMNGYIASRESTFAQTHTVFNERVYLTYAGGDGSAIRDPTRAFAQQLRRSNYAGLASAAREIEGERHSSTKAEGFERGLRFAFAPLAPSPSTMLPPGYGTRAPFVNLSTRGRVGSGENLMIAGLVIDGPEPKRVLIRAIGPGLGPQGVTDFVADPRLAVVDANHTTIASNDNWGQAPDPTALANAAAQVGAFALALNSRDAALLVTLEPGLYTVLVDGVNGAQGVAMVETYEVLP
jgi:predicted alpha/beta superfamily hydrolase